MAEPGAGVNGRRNLMDRYLQRAHDALQQATDGLSFEHLTARSIEGKWTIAEIVEHLSRAFSGTAEGVRRVLVKGNPTSRPADLRGRVRTFVVVQCGYLPTGRKAPKMTTPVGADPATIVAMALDHLRQMDEALSAAAAAFGDRVKLMDHPILGPLSTRHWRKFHWIHTRHHVRQINERRQSLVVGR